MPRDIPIGNGSLFVAFDSACRIREFHFPHVGEENHTKGEPFRIGVWVDGSFGWTHEGWRITMDYLDDSLVTDVGFLSDAHELRITAHDFVDFHENVYFKKVTVGNLAKREREVRLFFAHDFHIYNNEIGDTAAYRPEVGGIHHYKSERHFLINVHANKKYGIDHFATGNREFNDAVGTWRDAEDGVLSQNPIAQGSIDSVAGVHLAVPAEGEETFYLWISAGRNWGDVSSLDALVRRKGPETFFRRTRDYWSLWVNKEPIEAELLTERLLRLYKRSLLICRTQINNCGSIIAANDSDVVYFNRDTYSYMWTRDASLVAYALDRAGYYEITRNYFKFCAGLIEKDGYFLHKYTPSGSVASSWHPWQKDSRPQLPIQEDETALVLWALWKHYEIWRDVEFIRPLYKPLIKDAADFMMSYRDARTGLPLASYDLWEEQQGVFAFTASAVCGGLQAAANFTKAFGENELSEAYREGAQRMRRAMDDHLYLPAEKRFARMVSLGKDGVLSKDGTIDASLYGLFAFGAYEAGDERVRSTMDQVYEALWSKTGVGGVSRYEGDAYYRTAGSRQGNPWFITTLWLAQYYIDSATSPLDLDKGLELLEWTAKHALPSGVLAEQVDPRTGRPLSVSPLTWSHATYVQVVHHYLDARAAALGGVRTRGRGARSNIQSP